MAVVRLWRRRGRWNVWSYDVEPVSVHVQFVGYWLAIDDLSDSRRINVVLDSDQGAGPATVGAISGHRDQPVSTEGVLDGPGITSEVVPTGRVEHVAALDAAYAIAMDESVEAQRALLVVPVVDDWRLGFDRLVRNWSLSWVNCRC